MYDYAVIGSGIGGLFTAALLANKGKKVAVFEKHYLVGGYAHSFEREGYKFCAGLHYVFNSLPDEDGGLFFKTLGLDHIHFTEMDHDGFDRLRFPEFSYDIKRGVENNIDEIVERFPVSRKKMNQYYDVVKRLFEEAFQLPLDANAMHFIKHPMKYKTLFKYRNWTTQQLFDKLQLPIEVQAILSGQCGNIGIEPARSSLLAHSLNVMCYDQGAAYPTESYDHMIDEVTAFIKEQGGEIHLRTKVKEVLSEGNRVTGITLAKGDVVEAERYIFNADP